MRDTISNLLKWVFLIHFLVGIIFGVLYFFPEQILGLLGWPLLEPAVYRMVAAAMIGFAVSSLLAYRAANWMKVRIIVEMEIVWLICADIATILAIAAGYPPFIWVNFSVLLIFTVLFIYCYIVNMD